MANSGVHCGECGRDIQDSQESLGRLCGRRGICYGSGRMDRGRTRVFQVEGRVSKGMELGTLEVVVRKGQGLWSLESRV